MSPLTTIDRGLRNDRKQAQAHERKAKEAEADVLEKRRQGRVGDESPIEMTGVAEELQLIAMKAVAAVGGRWRMATAAAMPSRESGRVRGSLAGGVGIVGLAVQRIWAERHTGSDLGLTTLTARCRFPRYTLRARFIT